MKAVWYEQIGTADDVLRHGNTDDPEVSDGEVLVRIRTSGVNPSDVKTRGGARGELQFPRIIPHSDGAGKIEAVGNGVDKNRIGERVWLWNGAFGRAFGTCAEYISLPANQAVEIPENTTFEAGACMGIPASTAYHGVFSGGSVKNKTVLVTGGAGAVGHYAIQLAKWDGAQVITTVSGPEKGLAAEEAGADLVVNYKTDDVVEVVNNFTNAEGVDRIVEVEFGGNLSVSEQIIKTNGVIAAYGSVAVGNPELPFYNLMFKNAVLKMYLIYIVPGEARMKIIKGLTKALSENALVHQIAKSFDLTEYIVIISCLFFCFSAIAETSETNSVQIEKTKYIGIYDTENTQFIFRGIPYAKPPIGELRWKSPVPLSKEPKVINAQSFKPACMQDEYTTVWYQDVAELFGNPRTVFQHVDAVSEDCLYLNIWTNSLDQTSKKHRLDVLFHKNKKLWKKFL